MAFFQWATMGTAMGTERVDGRDATVDASVVQRCGTQTAHATTQTFAAKVKGATFSYCRGSAYDEPGARSDARW